MDLALSFSVNGGSSGLQLFLSPVPRRTRIDIPQEKDHYQDWKKLYQFRKNEDWKLDLFFTSVVKGLHLIASNFSDIHILCNSQVCVSILSEGTG